MSAGVFPCTYEIVDWPKCQTNNTLLAKIIPWGILDEIVWHLCFVTHYTVMGRLWFSCPRCFNLRRASCVWLCTSSTQKQSVTTHTGIRLQITLPRSQSLFLSEGVAREAGSAGTYIFTAWKAVFAQKWTLRRLRPRSNVNVDPLCSRNPYLFWFEVNT